jgi:hypothetical protein
MKSKEELPTEFAVQSNDFETYKKFKKDVELVGWKYDYNFMGFHQESFERCYCFCFMKNSIHHPFWFSFSNPSNIEIYNLDKKSEYKKALEHAKLLIGYKESSLVGEKINQSMRNNEINRTNPAMDKLIQLIEKYEIQRDTLNDVCEESAKAEYGFNLHVKILRDLQELKEKL